MSLQPVPIQNVPGVPDYTCTAFLPKSSDYCLLIADSGLEKCVPRHKAVTGDRDKRGDTDDS